MIRRLRSFVPLSEGDHDWVHRAVCPERCRAQNERFAGTAGTLWTKAGKRMETKSEKERTTSGLFESSAAEQNPTQRSDCRITRDYSLGAICSKGLVIEEEEKLPCYLRNG